ncbi:MAG: prolyl oligopeptidase family serine peptidase [Chlorobi bacterium]|nr:prolyl oligopeptidase family serine peptidase [Chlorobiota bacterium]
MKHRSIVLLAFFVGFQLFAQKTELTLEDANYMNRELYPVRISNLNWMDKGNYYTYEKDNSIYIVSAKRKTENLILDMDVLNGDLHRNNIDSVKKLPGIKFYDKDNCRFRINHDYYSYSLSTNKIELSNSIEKEAANVTPNKHNNNIAYTIKNNLFVAVNGEKIQITSDENPGIVNGQSVHRNEFGINGGIFWSPDGNRIAFYRMDETMVEDYPIVNINTDIATVENIKYPMTGRTSHEVTLGIYDIVSGTTVFMKTGKPVDQYLTTITWGPDGKFMYISLLNRDQNHLRLNKYDAVTGDLVKTLFEEKDDKYVEPETPLYFNPLNHSQFIWLSERSGFTHMYLYDTEGNLLNQLSNGNWLVSEFKGFYGNKNQKAYFMATKDGFLQNNLYSIDLNSLEITRITPEHGTHGVKISTDGKYVIDAYSNTESSRKYVLLDAKGKTLRTLKEPNTSLDDYNLGETKLLMLNSDDGTPLQARIILPPNFDETKKYPVFLYVYGGPHAQLITDSWLSGAGLWLNYMAAKGYIVFTLDNRGSAKRGRDFEQAIFRNCGSVEVDDQMVGVDYLKSLPYVDADRIGVDGWSYGGFMTISLMLKKPGVFKVACAGGPVIDWKYYEVMYGERYMDTPQTNPEGFKNSSLLNYVDKLDGRLLIIHGTSDPTVVWQNSLQFIKKCVDKGKMVDYFVYPGHKHNVRGKDRVHLYRKIEQYFRDYL